MSTESKLVVTLQDDGTVKIDARGVVGSSDEIMATLNELASAVGGELTVEKHVGTHTHSHMHSEKVKHRH